jgi:hypothetical protein
MHNDQQTKFACVEVPSTRASLTLLIGNTQPANVAQVDRARALLVAAFAPNHEGQYMGTSAI